MGIGKVFKNIGSFLWNALKKVVKSSKDLMIDDLKTLAVPIVEQITKIDFDGDGKIAAAKEILDAAKNTGLKWGIQWLEMGEEKAIEALSKYYTEGDLRRWLAFARTANSIVAKYGALAFPAHSRVVNGIIEIVLNEIMDNIHN